MTPLVRITDVSPRDGLQNEPLGSDGGGVSTQNKLELITRLIRAGMDEIELTSFVSPKWVPQLADAEDVAAQVRDLARRTKAEKPEFSVLVPNEKGFERALHFHDPSGGFPLKIALFTAASETFSKKNTNATIAESIERFKPIIPRAIDAGMRIRLYISCAIACPFEGAIAPGAVRAVVDQLRTVFDAEQWKNTAEIDLGDTIGVATVEQLDSLLAVFTPDERAALTLHLHDTSGRAALCVRRALELGVRSFDGAAGGLGGCPYASHAGKRAPGNVSTETLLSAVQAAGFQTKVDERLLAEAGAFARSIVQTSSNSGGAS